MVLFSLRDDFVKPQVGIEEIIIMGIIVLEKMPKKGKFLFCIFFGWELAIFELLWVFSSGKTALAVPRRPKRLEVRWVKQKVFSKNPSRK
jgi:hypothetical protein